MRKLTVALLIALLAGTSGSVVTPQSAAAAGTTLSHAKVVVVVGAVQGTTSTYRGYADSEAAELQKFTDVPVTKIYSPNATWGAVSAAAKGANILLYLGHGSGFPNPYVGYRQPNGDNGMGLNATAAGTDNNTKYYGENYMAQLGLAPNAIVLLNHLCYASGDNEWGAGNPTLPTAMTRVDGYASGFIRGGAKAVIAEGLYEFNGLINSLFNSHSTIDAAWKAMSSFQNNVSTWSSTRNPGFTSAIDPSRSPAPDGDIYYRSMVSIPTLRTDDIISGTIPAFASTSGTYYPLPPTRIVDTRTTTPGPLGTITSGGASTYQIAGNGGIPSNAIAVTANLTVTNQQSYGWLAIGPNLRTTPTTSSLNFPVSDNRANGVTVPLSPQGTADIYYGGGAGLMVDFIVDVTGYFLSGTGGNGYVQYGPQRQLDTRTTDGGGALASGQPRKIPLAGRLGLPASGVVAVAGNVTVVNASARGYVFVGPTTGSVPTSSTINFPAGDTRANNFIVPLAPDGSIAAVYYAGGAASVDLVIDISGYYVAGSGAQYHTLNPARILDTRSGIGGLPVFSTGVPQTLTVAGAGGVPTGALALTANMTATGQTTGGHASIGPSVPAAPTFSNLNFRAGDTRANGVIAPLTNDGKVQLVFVGYSGATAHLLLDVCGYYK